MATTALRRLTEARATTAGMRVMGDFTTNHTGAAHEWFSPRRRSDPDSDERGFYL